MRHRLAPLVLKRGARTDSLNRIKHEATEINPVGIQQLTNSMRSKVFGKSHNRTPSTKGIDLAQEHLSYNDLLGKKTSRAKPIDFTLPKLLGNSLDEHFFKIGKDVSEPYFTNTQKFVSGSIPKRPDPSNWVKQSGWTKYKYSKKTDRYTPQKVDCPDEKVLVFDVEVMYKEHDYAVIATACSDTAWYAWISPWLLGESDRHDHLIPLSSDRNNKNVVIGHNVGYDRKRVSDEYHIEQSGNFFLDTMSLHIAVNGMCSRQRPQWKKMNKQKTEEDESFEDEVVENPWYSRSALNGLADVAYLHCGIQMDKSTRDVFGGEYSRQDCVDNLETLLDYCATDVHTTFKVAQKVFPAFLRICPHPVSFAGLRQLSTVFLPINEQWDKYVETAERTYQDSTKKIYEQLKKLANEAVKLKDSPEKYKKDPWLSQLDWEIVPTRMIKGKKKGDPDYPDPRQKLPGMPNWYKGLFPSASKPMNLSVRTRMAPILLRLQWDGHPLVWTNTFGWVFKTTRRQQSKYEKLNYSKCDMTLEDLKYYKDSRTHVYFRIPHKDGPSARCVSPMAKTYISYFEQGILMSEFELAKEAIQLNSQGSYWSAARERIFGQMPVYTDTVDMGMRVPGKESVTGGARTKAIAAQAANDNNHNDDNAHDTNNNNNNNNNNNDNAATNSKNDNNNNDNAATNTKINNQKLGIIIPKLISMGTITRRAVEDTWLTASNAKKTRVGSELKAMVQAPPGYKFVGADVDSEELWIASLIGDSLFGLHGGTALGWMTLEGTKAAETDLHSKTAKILGISRNEAKVFNYGRIYGAGLKFASTLLRQFNPMLSVEEANATANKLYEATKGCKTRVKGFKAKQFWRGGSESVVFNKLEELAERDTPRTPVLRAAITEALTKKHLGTSANFLTSRINWSIQSSGVDYLHLLVTSMDYLIRRYKINARLCITVHDEIRYLVKESDQYKAALALQISNLWTRAMFCQQLGIDNVPQSVAFFSLIDIDHVMRKEVDLDCVTPSHPDPIEPGKAIDIYELLEKCPKLTGEQRGFKIGDYQYEAFNEAVDTGSSSAGDAEPYPDEFLRAQILTDSEQVKALAKKVRKMSGVKPTPRKRRNLVDPPPGPVSTFLDLDTIRELNSSANVNANDFWIDGEEGDVATQIREYHEHKSMRNGSRKGVMAG